MIQARPVLARVALQKLTNALPELVSSEGFRTIILSKFYRPMRLSGRRACDQTL